MIGYNSADMHGVLETAAALLVGSSEQILAPGGTPVPRSQLRWEFASVAVAVTLLAAAIVALALFIFRRRTRDPTLIYFGVFCILYALRLLAFRQSFRALFGAPASFWFYANWFITCTINIPFGLFLYQVVSAELRRFVRSLLTVQVGFAVFGIVAAVLGANLAKLFIANEILVLSTVAYAGLILIGVKRDPALGNRFTHEVRVIVGCAIWFAFVVHANLLGLGILPGHNVEFIGFLVFVGCLGYIATSRTFANEERLLALNKELEIARRIQGSTLPRSVPSMAGLEIAARYVPMSAVAGDFYDFLVIDERRIGVLVADVTGHGVPAALIASMLKTAFAGQAPHASDPALVLTGLNRALCGKFEEHFVTAAYLFVDLETRRLTYSAAGHPPLMLASRESGSRNGAVREIEENGLMLGMIPEAEYRSAEIGFSSGDRCLLYTGGLLEAKNEAQEEFGKSRCKRLLETERATPTGGSRTCSLGISRTFPVTALAAHRKTTLRSSSLIFRNRAVSGTSRATGG